MEERTVRQWQGTAELLRDGVQGAARAVGTAHQEIADIPYGVLRRVPGLAEPAAAAGDLQREITRLAYCSVRAAAGVLAAGVALALQLHDLTRAG